MMALDAANEGWPMMTSGCFARTENYMLLMQQYRKCENGGGRKSASTMKRKNLTEMSTPLRDSPYRLAKVIAPVFISLG